jgi:NAD(P)-dependent dehydrogenase (short-subunit alcohol dehydrogenase family)
MHGPLLLEDRVALVTGGARGIGLAVAGELHRLGARVMIADAGLAIDGTPEDPAAAEAAADGMGERAAAFSRDLAEPGAPEAAVAATLERFGAIDMVVSNAAVLRDGFVFKATRADWERSLAVNLHAPFALLAAAAGPMREQAKAGRAPGRIVAMISTAGLVGNLGQAAYAAAKAGLVGLVRVTAMDLARSGITCNAVAPFAATRVTDSIRPANEAQAQYKSRALTIPAGFVARLVAYLCSPANDFTGQVFGVRGREVFLFSQSRPVARVVGEPLDAQDPIALGGVLEAHFADQLTDLATDLELFNTEPLV